MIKESVYNCMRIPCLYEKVKNCNLHESIHVIIGIDWEVWYTSGSRSVSGRLLKKEGFRLPLHH